MNKQLSIGLTVLALAGSLTACGAAAGTSPATAPAASAAAANAPAASATSPAPQGQAAAADLRTAASGLGKIVVDGKGMSVYYFTKDVKDSGKSACEGQCLAAWPPVFTTNDQPVVDGVTGKIGTITTADGKKQVTVDGLPVYYYVKDKAAGDVTGQDVGKVWYLVSPDGTMIK